MRGPVSRQRMAINTNRDRALAAGVELDGVRYHADDTFLAELSLLILGYDKGILTGTQPIRTVDNQVLQLTGEQITALALAVGQYRQQVYATSWAEKDALS